MPLELERKPEQCQFVTVVDFQGREELYHLRDEEIASILPSSEPCFSKTIILGWQVDTLLMKCMVP